MNKTVMIENKEEKKRHFVEGTVNYPLAVGAQAVVVTDEGRLTTSTVEHISCVSPDSVWFETRNSHYCVTLKKPLAVVNAG